VETRSHVLSWGLSALPRAYVAWKCAGIATRNFTLRSPVPPLFRLHRCVYLSRPSEPRFYPVFPFVNHVLWCSILSFVERSISCYIVLTCGDRHFLSMNPFFSLLCVYVCVCMCVCVGGCQTADPNLLWLAEHTKECPKCGRSVQKNDGCFSMTCKCTHKVRRAYSPVCLRRPARYASLIRKVVVVSLRTVVLVVSGTVEYAQESLRVYQVQQGS
jgi:hypothetical protein